MEKFVVTSFLFRVVLLGFYIYRFSFYFAFFFVKIIKLLELLFCYCSLILFDAGLTENFTLLNFTLMNKSFA